MYILENSNLSFFELKIEYRHIVINSILSKLMPYFWWFLVENNVPMDSWPVKVALSFAGNNYINNHFGFALPFLFLCSSCLSMLVSLFWWQNVCTPSTLLFKWFLTFHCKIKKEFCNTQPCSEYYFVITCVNKTFTKAQFHWASWIKRQTAE